jgi:hypothetical protein
LHIDYYYTYTVYHVITGALTTTQISKPKLVIAPVISQLAQTSTTSTSGSQSQPPKHMANLLLPVNIPQQSGTAKSSMFNLKINNGQLSTDSKGTITGIKIRKMLKDNKV